MLLTGVLDQTDSAVHDLRRVAHQLRPPTLDALGLVEAVRAHASDTPNPCIRVDAPPALRPLPRLSEIAAYRIILEALHNVTGHAHAQHCTIRIQQQPTTLAVEVTDDGCGIPADHPPGTRPHLDEGTSHRNRGNVDHHRQLHRRNHRAGSLGRSPPTPRHASPWLN